MSIQTFYPKMPGETLNLALDFANLMGAGVSLQAPVAVAITVRDGVDPAVSGMANGAAQIVGTYVVQSVTAGVADVDYTFTATVATSDGQTLEGIAMLPVRAEA